MGYLRVKANRGRHLTDPRLNHRLFGRIKQALAREYEIEAVLGAGGMGLVLRARHVRLDRTVAVKVLRPEQATATGTSRFLAEARLLARLSHPNVVSVFDAGEEDGLLYFVMEYLPGKSLAERLIQGPLDPEQLTRLSRDLIAGLEAAHRIGVIHRDIKPSNVFLKEGKALLGDFGLARVPDGSDPELTAPGQAVGTPRYMPPELKEGLEATRRTDVYGAAMVIWEAATGSVWPAGVPPDRADWRGIAPNLAAPLQRALSIRPEDRFADATEFRLALIRPGGRLRRIMIGVAAVALGGLLVWRALPRAEIVSPGRGIALALSPLTSDSRAGRALGDSLRDALIQALAGYPDFLPFAGKARSHPGAVEIDGNLVLRGDSLRLLLVLRGPGGVSPLAAGPFQGARFEWPRLADSAAVVLARSLWDQQADAIGLAAALPRSGAGFTAWFRGEQLWARGEWDAAGRAYGIAEQVDTTCLLCSYRLVDIGRWLALPRDERRLHRLRQHQESFPLHYQDLIRAAAAKQPERLARFEEVTRNHPEFFLGWFEAGDELMHRGPLYGRLRAEALRRLYRSVRLRPRFGPALEHYAYLLIWRGDSTAAREALDRLGRVESGSQFTAAFRQFLELGFAWRFFQADSASRLGALALARSEVRDNPLAAAGARLMMTLNSPQGAVGLGRLLAGLSGYSEFVVEGTLGQVFGHAALGQLDSLLIAGGRLARLGDASAGLLAIELATLLQAFDPDSLVRHNPRAGRDLEGYLLPGMATPTFRHRAAWASGILAVRTGATVRVNRALAALRDEPEPRILGRILEAAVRGAEGNPQVALSSLPALPPLDALEPYPDQLAETASRMLRAEWLEALGRLDSARRELRWHEHLEVMGHGGGEPHPGEPAWAIGTLASWWRGRLLDRMASKDRLGTIAPERCMVYRNVAEGWSSAPPPFRTRADSARVILARDCGTRP